MQSHSCRSCSLSKESSGQTWKVETVLQIIIDSPVPPWPQSQADSRSSRSCPRHSERHVYSLHCSSCTVFGLLCNTTRTAPPAPMVTVHMGTLHGWPSRERLTQPEEIPLLRLQLLWNDCLAKPTSFFFFFLKIEKIEFRLVLSRISSPAPRMPCSNCPGAGLSLLSIKQCQYNIPIFYQIHRGG